MKRFEHYLANYSTGDVCGTNEHLKDSRWAQGTLVGAWVLKL